MFPPDVPFVFTGRLIMPYGLLDLLVLTLLFIPGCGDGHGKCPTATRWLVLCRPSGGRDLGSTEAGTNVPSTEAIAVAGRDPRIMGSADPRPYGGAATPTTGPQGDPGRDSGFQLVWPPAERSIGAPPSYALLALSQDAIAAQFYSEGLQAHNLETLCATSCSRARSGRVSARPGPLCAPLSRSTTDNSTACLPGST